MGKCLLPVEGRRISWTYLLVRCVGEHCSNEKLESWPELCPATWEKQGLVGIERAREVYKIFAAVCVPIWWHVCQGKVLHYVLWDGGAPKESIEKSVAYTFRRSGQDAVKVLLSDLEGVPAGTKTIAWGALCAQIPMQTVPTHVIPFSQTCLKRHNCMKLERASSAWIVLQLTWTLPYAVCVDRAGCRLWESWRKLFKSIQSNIQGP